MGVAEEFLTVVGNVITAIIENGGATSRTIITTIVAGVTDVVSIIFTGSK